MTAFNNILTLHQLDKARDAMSLLLAGKMKFWQVQGWLMSEGISVKSRAEFAVLIAISDKHHRGQPKNL